MRMEHNVARQGVAIALFQTVQFVMHANTPLAGGADVYFILSERG